MGERRPRRSDYDETGDYYTSLLGWLARRYPGDQVARIKKWHAIERKDDMPVKRAVKPTRKSALDLAVERELDEMFERLGIDPHADEKERMRLVELFTLDRDLTAKEQAELDRLAKRYRRRNRKDRRREEALAKRKAEHPEETHDEAWIAVVLEPLRKRDLRRAAKKKANKKARRKAARARAAAEPAEAREAPTAPASRPATALAVASEPLDAARPRRRRRVGVVAQYDAFGHRVD